MPDQGPTGKPDVVFGWIREVADPLPRLNGCPFCDDALTTESGPQHAKDCPNRPFNQGG